MSEAAGGICVGLPKTASSKISLTFSLLSQRFTHGTVNMWLQPQQRNPLSATQRQVAL